MNMGTDELTAVERLLQDERIDNPFSPKLLPMSPVYSVIHASGLDRFEMVARGGPIRKANQDSAAARRVRIGLSRSESIEPPTRGFSVA